jgi:hypothetical protein
MPSVLGTPTSVNNGGSYTAEAGSNRAVVFGVHVGATGLAATITGLTFGGVSCVEALQYCELGSEWGMEGCYYLLEASIPSGSQTLTATVSAGTVDEISCLTLDDVSQVSPVRETGSTEAIATNALTANFSSTVAGDFGIILGHGGRIESYNTYSNGWAETLRHNIATTRTHIVATKSLVGDATTDDCAMGSGGISNRRGCLWVAFADGGGGGGASGVPRFMNVYRRRRT